MTSPPQTLVALTGATGFIGRRIALRMLAQGCRVRALLRPRSPRADMVPEGCELVAAPLRPGNPRLADALRSADALVHCAGTVRGRREADFRPGNVDSTEALVDALAPSGAGPRRFLLLSSLAASRPELSPYAASKRAGEERLREGGGALDWTILRPPAVHGPGDREMQPLFDLIRRGILPRVGPPGQRLSLLHADDLADAVLAWLRQPPPRRQTYAIDDGREGGYTLEAIADILRPGRPRLTLPIPGPALHTAARINLAASALFRYAPMLSPGKARELRQPDWTCPGHGRDFARATGWQPRRPLDKATS